MNPPTHAAALLRNTSGRLENLNIESQQRLITPEQLKARLPATEAVRESVQAARQAVRDILDRRDHRLLVVVGPCSIHDVDAARDYAARLQRLAPEVEDSLLLVMRAYFEKPRTTVGWKGLINDPHLDDSFRIDEGLALARQVLLDIAATGLPVATEALDPISPQYLQDLIAWSAIGARTTESQTHREMASGLSSAVGFKNGTDGSLDVAINALQSVASPHRFLGIDSAGQVAVLHTRGNRYGHVVLRGGTRGPNYAADAIVSCEAALARVGAPQNIMVDCSHANSMKDHNRQPLVARDIRDQILAGNHSLIGLMIESFLEAGNQPIRRGREGLRYGVSVTDACIDWATTADLLRELAQSLAAPLRARPARRRTDRSAVVGVLGHRVVGHVADRRQFGDLGQQRLLDTVLEGDVDGRAALAAAAEAQHRDAVFDHLDQRNLAAVRGQAGVHLVIENVVDAVFQRRIRPDARRARIRRLDGQLAAHPVFLEVDLGLRQVG
jgi:3-deoxy-7-phosphoheptulonate synthase